MSAPGSVISGARESAAADVPRGACAAVVVHWTGAEDTARCVRSLRADAPGLPVVVVDNASEDGSGAAVGRALADMADVEVLRAPRNGGFGAGCNLGFERVLAWFSGVRHVLLVNPDAVVEPGTVGALLDVASRHPDAGIVGGMVLDESGRRVLYESGRFRPWTLGPSHARAPRHLEEHATEFVTGALMLVDADLLRDGVRFDERFFLYVEDLDLCCEVRARGRSLWVTRRARIRHAEGGSQRGEPPVLGSMRALQLAHIARGKTLLIRKRLKGLQWMTAMATALVLRPLCGLFVAHGVRFLSAYYRGVLSGLREPLGRRRRAP